MTPVLSLRGLTKTYPGPDGEPAAVLAGLDLDVAEGEFVAVIGFSGSGKTTLVSAIAGLIDLDGGEVLVRGEPCTGPGADRGVVFQSYSLMPWLTVEGNVRLAVDSVHKGAGRAEREGMVAGAIGLVGLTAAKDRKPAQLSGGMRQRVAVARALVAKPEILLLDEPLSALDALTRARLQDEIERIRRQEERTIVLVTNSVDEALLLADRVAVLEPSPGGWIGHTFEVDVPRPRERVALNHDPAYQALRNEIVAYLSELEQARAGAATGADAAPALAPLRRSRSTTALTAAAPAAAPVRSFLDVRGVSKVYPTPDGPLTVVAAFDLQVARGEFVSIIGHSGCGKSTVLAMLAGLNDATTGAIALDGQPVDAAGPDKAVVFQAPSLLPWLTARGNVALGVDRVYPGAPAAERRALVEHHLERVGLADAMDKRPAELSNGMRQRVGLARAFALSPKLLLLDEPFGMLDTLTRWDLQDVLLDVWSRSEVTAVCVTHDVDEAIVLADRVVMMTDGPRARIGGILDIDLERPRDHRSLVGHPRFYAYREQLLAFLASGGEQVAATA